MGNIRRSRGYSFEIRLQDYFNNINKDKRESDDHEIDDCELWNARRLAPSSISLPDVLVTYKYKIFAIEAKSTASMVRLIEIRQLKNACDHLNIFPLYSSQYVVASWYFMRKTTKKEDTKKIRIFTIVWKKDMFLEFLEIATTYNILLVTCDYNGNIRFRIPQTLKKKGVLLQDKIYETEINEKVKDLFPYKRFYNLESFVKFFS